MLALSLTARAEGNKIPLAFRERGQREEGPGGDPTWAMGGGPMTAE